MGSEVKAAPESKHTPIDVFPVYDEQPGPRADDPPSVWILRREKLHQGSGLPGRGLLLKKPHPAEPMVFTQNPRFFQSGSNRQLDRIAEICYLI